MKRNLILILPFILVSVYNAKGPEKETVSFTILESNDVEHPHYIGFKSPKIAILSNDKSYRNLYLSLHIDEVTKPQAPSVDFTKNRVLFISFGKTRNTVYPIKRLNIYIQNNVLIVKTEFSPPEYDFVSPLITHHYLLIQVPKDGYKRAEWRDVRGGRLWKTIFTMER